MIGQLFNKQQLQQMCILEGGRVGGYCSVDVGKLIEPQPLGANYWLRIFDENAARQLKCLVSLLSLALYV